MLTFCQNMPFFFQQFSLGISQLNVVGQEYFFCIQGPLGCRKQAGAIPSSPCLVSSSRRASQRPILGQPLRLPVPGHETPGLAPPHPRQVQRIVHRASVSEPVTDSFLPAAGDRSPRFHFGWLSWSCSATVQFWTEGFLNFDTLRFFNSYLWGLYCHLVMCTIRLCGGSINMCLYVSFFPPLFYTYAVQMYR